MERFDAVDHEDATDRSSAVRAALLVGFDFAVREGFIRLLGDPPIGAERDRLADMLNSGTESASPALGRIVAAAWRAALTAVAEGSEPDEARAALLAIEIQIPSDA
jgi:hypothetical protein